MSPKPAQGVASQNRFGLVLVMLQFALMYGLFASAWPVWRSFQAPAGAWALLLGGVLIGVWALSFNRLGNFNIRPTPKPGAQLVREGPYRWIRHPMYTAVLTCGSAAAWSSGAVAAWLALLGLLVVLLLKAHLEESWLLLVHPSYANYQVTSKRLIPWLY